MQVCFEGATAEGIADLVDMSAEEVSELLRGEASIRALPGGKLLQAVERTCSSLSASLSSGVQLWHSFYVKARPFKGVPACAFLSLILWG